MFRALTLHSGDIVSLLDGQGRLLYNSPAAERISGFSAEELAGIDTFQLIHPEDRERVGAVFAEVLATPGAVRSVQYRYQTKAGGYTWMEAVASNHLDNPDVRGVVANSRDISERKRAELEQAQLEARLMHAQKLESLGTLAGGVAHDLNNLLVGILGATDLARGGLPEGHPSLEPLRIAVEAAGRAGGLCRQLLAFAGRAEPRLEVFPLEALLTETGELLDTFAGRRVTLAREVAPGLPHLLGDPGQLRQVLLNLVVNAADAIGDRGGHITLRAEAVEADRDLLATFLHGEECAPGRLVLLEVVDDGPGMPPEVLARIFEPFFTTKQGGRGLGLASTLGIVKRHGGAIRVASEPGKGTRFTLLMPPAPAPAASLSAPAPAAAWRGAGRVLVVDDEPLVRTVAQQMLQRMGFETEAAADGLEGAAAVERDPARFAAVLLDLTMPRLDGAGALARIRAVAPRLPVILSSGFAAAESQGDLAALGATAFVEKPYTSATLRNALAAATT